METVKRQFWKSELILSSIKGSFLRLDPRLLRHNPVMFVVEIVSVITSLISVTNLLYGGPFRFNIQITVWLWFTVLFANFAEALAEGRGKAQAETLRRAQSEAHAKRLTPDGQIETIRALSLRKGDMVLVEGNDPIPGDGDIVEGASLVDESAVTGESAPVIREAKGDRTGVTGGTRVLSGRIVVRITASAGETFLDHMISMVESAKRQKTPNERALEILLMGLTVLFIVVVGTLAPFAAYTKVAITVPVLVALLVCLIPTTIGGLLPAIGIAGMDRLIQRNVIALSGRAVEASGDVNIVLLDKTGTITLGNRMATDFIAASGVEKKELIEAALFASLADETPEGRSIVTLAKHRLAIHGHDIKPAPDARFIPFTPELRMSGISWNGREIRKGASDAVLKFVQKSGGIVHESVYMAVDGVAREGGTPLVVADSARTLGVVYLKDVLKEGIKERLTQLRLLGIRSIMITGDNPLTAAAIAAEAGIDDFVAQARPEEKLSLIRKYQAEGNLVAMIGDGTNDAPALAQADVAVAMNAGTQASREAANMVDLDSNPTKLLDIVEIGKQILMTRGALTTFSVANDVAKYFAIIPAIFVSTFPALGILNIMRLATPQSAMLSAIIFNAIIIPLLIPLSLKGIKYRPMAAMSLLWRNLAIYGIGGLILPFAGIKLIDLVIVFFRLA
jgi:K+-transporting ATPase ATPase B chain